MITIIWRGTGILIPIFLAISFWITSYWFEDTRLGNYSYLGWSILWASILITLLGLTDLVKNVPDENGNVETKKQNDFFWIPVLVWGIILLVSSIYFIIKGPKHGYGDNKKTSSDYLAEIDELKQTAQRETVELNFYNANADTSVFQILKLSDENFEMDGVIPPKEVRGDDFSFGKYNLKINGGLTPITIPKPSNVSTNTKYYANWYVIGENVSMLLVDVTEACRSDINETELREINWTKRIVKEYSGTDVMEIVLNDTNQKSTYYFYNPGDELPVGLKENEKVFTLIPFNRNKGYSEDYIDDAIIELCY